MANGESVYAKLRSAQRAGLIPGARQMDHALTAFAAECSLRRLGNAGMLPGVVLKGGRLWSAWDMHGTRPTRDFDYSAQRADLRKSGDSQGFEYASRVLAALAADADDGLVVDPKAFKVSLISSALGGCAIEGPALLHTARIPLVVEIGFGHELPSGSTETLSLDPMVPGVGVPLRIEAYKPEMWLAEKIRIAIAYGDGNTRLKDYFDMHLLFAMEIDPGLLRSCFEATCRDFDVVPPATLDGASGLSPEFAERNGLLWRDRRWPEWTGAPFRKGADPELSVVVSTIGSKMEEFGLFGVAAVPRP